MAGEDYGTGAGNQNPTEWFSDYTYLAGSDVVSFAIDTTASKGFSDAIFAGASGDVRALYHSIIEKLYTQYTTKEAISGFDMPDHMKMGKAEVLDAANDKKTTVYTFSIEQSQNVGGGFTAPTPSGSASYIDETNA